MSPKLVLFVAALAVSGCAAAATTPALTCPKSVPKMYAENAVHHRYHLDADAADDVGYDTQWALARIGAPAAWTRTKGDSRTIVAVIDSGLDLTHPDLMGQVWTSPPDEEAAQGSVDQQALAGGMLTLYGANFFRGDERHPCDLFRGPQIAFPCDAEGHGTAVASIIAAQTGNAIGIAGVAWHATILPVKILDEDTDGCAARACFPQHAAEAIKFAQEKHAQILNLSWGGGDDDADLLAALRALDQKKVLVVAAAGNTHSNIDCAGQEHYPASYADKFDNLLVVGSSDSTDALCQHSNFGSKVHLYAPGCGVAAAELNGNYGTKDGTSIAAPHAAGAAVLLKRLAPTWSAPDIKRYLIDSADHPASLHVDGDPRPLPRLNVDRATSAPVELDPRVENTIWERGDLHHVAWALRFKSTGACTAGELWLRTEDGRMLQRFVPTYGSMYNWSDAGADVRAAPKGAGPWRVRLVARCAGTGVVSTSAAFTLL